MEKVLQKLSANKGENVLHAEAACSYDMLTWLAEA